MEKVLNLERILGGISRVEIRPWKLTDGNYIAPAFDDTDDIYTLPKCIKDSTSITTEDGDSTTIQAENNNTIWSQKASGSTTFTTEIADLQDNVLTGLLGYTIEVDGENTYRHSPSNSWYQYATIRMFFADGTNALTCWKAKMYSTLTAESLSSDVANGTITATLEEFNFGDETTPKLRKFSVDTIG